MCKGDIEGVKIGKLGDIDMARFRTLARKQWFFGGVLTILEHVLGKSARFLPLFGGFFAF